MKRLLKVIGGFFLVGIGTRIIIDESFRDSIKRNFNLHDSKGLKYTHSELESIFPEIIYLDIKEQAKYADVVTSNSLKFVEEQIIYYEHLPEENLKQEMDKFNATSIGNLAYIYLNTKDDKIKSIIDKLFISLKSYYKEN